MTIINIDNLKTFVVLQSASTKQFHICTKFQYKYAAELNQPGYDWTPVESFDTEAECEEFVSNANAPKDFESMTVAALKEYAASKAYPEADYNSMKKAELIIYIKGKEGI